MLDPSTTRQNKQTCKRIRWDEDGNMSEEEEELDKSENNEEVEENEKSEEEREDSEEEGNGKSEEESEVEGNEETQANFVKASFGRNRDYWEGENSFTKKAKPQHHKCQSVHNQKYL